MQIYIYIYVCVHLFIYLFIYLLLYVGTHLQYPKNHQHMFALPTATETYSHRIPGSDLRSKVLRSTLWISMLFYNVLRC